MSDKSLTPEEFYSRDDLIKGKISVREASLGTTEAVILAVEYDEGLLSFDTTAGTFRTNESTTSIWEQDDGSIVLSNPYFGSITVKPHRQKVKA